MNGERLISGEVKRLFRKPAYATWSKICPLLNSWPTQLLGEVAPLLNEWPDELRSGALEWAMQCDVTCCQTPHSAISAWCLSLELHPTQLLASPHPAWRLVRHLNLRSLTEFEQERHFSTLVAFSKDPAYFPPEGSGLTHELEIQETRVLVTRDWAMSLANWQYSEHLTRITLGPVQSDGVADILQNGTFTRQAEIVS